MAKNTTKNGTAPTRLGAFQVRDRELNGAKRSQWTRAGVAFPHSDGKGFNVELHALPVDGKVVLRTHEPKEAVE